MAQETKFFPARGGLDLITPAIEKDPGSLIACENYEAHPRGYSRTDGYERFDGQQKPSTASYWALNFDAGTATISEGDTVTGATSGATGLAIIDAVVESGSYGGSNADGYLVLMNVSGTSQGDENLQVSAVTKCVADGTATQRGADNDTDDSTWLQDAMETARTAIAVVPGSGNMRGVCTLAGTTYAFRDNAGATEVDVYKSTTAGWTQVALGKQLAFTSGGTTEIEEGQTITGATGGATAVLTRVALQSGSWAGGDAAGFFIFASQTRTLQSENINVGAATNLATIAGDSSDNSLAAAGRFEFERHNFGGHAGADRIYGCDSVSMGFEFDGTVFVPIKTGMTTDTPSHVAVHHNQLFFFFSGGSIQNSGIGLPYQWTVVTGASEMMLGEEITGAYSDVEGFLVIGGRNKIAVLYGQDTSNFELVTWSDESGVIEWTMDRLGSTLFVDDIGVRRLTAARDYGNFRLGTMTQKIEPYLKILKAASTTINASIRTRTKDMYRVFYSDGTGISVYFGRGINKPECAIFKLPIVVHCAYSGEDANGDEFMLFGSTDGYIYELDAGANHDGTEISGYIRFAFNHVGSPTQNKQWFKATLEVDANPSVALGMTAEFGYASDDQPPATEESFTVSGGGGFWEEAIWDDFQWSAPVEGLAENHLAGFGTNVSLAALSAGTYDYPHRIHGLTLHFSPRGLVK